MAKNKPLSSVVVSERGKRLRPEQERAIADFGRMKLTERQSVAVNDARTILWLLELEDIEIRRGATVLRAIFRDSLREAGITPRMRDDPIEKIAATPEDIYWTWLGYRAAVDWRRALWTGDADAASRIALCLANGIRTFYAAYEHIALLGDDAARTAARQRGTKTVLDEASARHAEWAKIYKTLPTNHSHSDRCEQVSKLAKPNKKTGNPYSPSRIRRVL